MSTALAVLDKVQRQLATITTVEEAKEVRDQVEALRIYAKRSRQTLAIQNQVALVKFSLERRAGELLLAVPKVQGQRETEQGLVQHIRKTGLTTYTAYRWMNLAEIPERELLRLAAECDADDTELTATLVYDGLVKRWGSNGAELQPPPPAATDLLGAADLVMKRRILEPGDLAGLAPDVANMVVNEVAGVYDDFCEDPRWGKVPTGEMEDGRPATASTKARDGATREKQRREAEAAALGGFKERWNPPVTINVTGLRYLARKAVTDLRGARLTPTVLRHRLRGFFDEAVARWEQRKADPTAPFTKKATPYSNVRATRSTDRLDPDAVWDIRFARLKETAQQFIAAAQALVAPYDLLLEPPRIVPNDALAVVHAVRAAVDTLEQDVATPPAVKRSPRDHPGVTT